MTERRGQWKSNAFAEPVKYPTEKHPKYLRMVVSWDPGQIPLEEVRTLLPRITQVVKQHILQDRKNTYTFSEFPGKGSDWSFDIDPKRVSDLKRELENLKIKGISQGVVSWQKSV